MSKRTQQQLRATTLGLVGVGAVLALSAAIMLWLSVDLTPEPWKAWKELRTGMTKQQVMELLGDWALKHGPDTNIFGFRTKEYWEYGAWSFLFGPSAQAYVIWFDAEGKVSSFRRPKQKPETSP